MVTRCSLISRRWRREILSPTSHTSRKKEEKPNLVCYSFKRVARRYVFCQNAPKNAELNCNGQCPSFIVRIRWTSGFVCTLMKRVIIRASLTVLNPFIPFCVTSIGIWKRKVSPPEFLGQEWRKQINAGSNSAKVHYNQLNTITLLIGQPHIIK